MLRIGVNALYLIPGGVGGTEIYLRHLLAALAEVDAANQYFIFTNIETGTDIVPRGSNFKCVPLRVRATWRPARVLWEQTALPAAVRRLRLTALLNPGFTAPLFCPCPQVTVFHDMQHKRHPEHFRWFDLPFWRFLLYWSARRSDFLVAVSEATSRDLLHFYRLGPERVRVVPQGVDPTFFEIARNRAPEPYFLCVSTLHPHKNLDSLLRAFAEFQRGHSQFRLVIAGLRGFHASQLERLRASLGLENAVTFTGWVAREKLYDLYTRAWAFFYPSTFEGFGMPVLEALAAGIPSACSRIEPLITIAGSAALQFDPMDRAAIAGAMFRLASEPDLRARLAKEGPMQAQRYSWTAAARGTLELLQRAAGVR